VDLDSAIRQRRMCRDFSEAPLDPAIVDRLIDRARRAPSAGHTQGWAWVVLEGPAVETFWSHDEERARAGGVARAPVIVLPVVSQAAYLSRYAEPDKAGTGRDRPGGWPVPYWWVDGGGAVATLLLGAVAEGVGALFFALHHDPTALLERLEVPAGWQPLGAIALGWPAPGWRDRAPGSASRGRRALDEVMHRGRWSPGPAGRR
jgi:nitroreductase